MKFSTIHFINPARLRVFFYLILALATPSAMAGVGEGRERPVRTTNKGIPIHSYGSTWILGQSPDFLTSVTLQEQNTKNPIRKMKLKKSWEIKEGWTGGCPPRLPRTEMMDRLQAPLLPINLLDEDPDTYWCSRGQSVPDLEPVWIRLDLPQETWIKSVVLQKRTRPYRVSWQIPARPGKVMAAGEAVPRELTIKVSQDAHHWTTVAQRKDLSTTGTEKNLVFDFPPRPVKQIWILGNHCPMVDIWGYCFSLAGVEVIDAQGENVAAARRGTGVTVSSTEPGQDEVRIIMDDLWATAWDLGFKWVRACGWDSVLVWSHVEREKGKYYIDPKADQAITDLVSNGVHVILPLCYGNYLYSPYGPRKWEKETTDIMEMAGPPLTEEEHQAFLRWARFMARHFKGRVEYYSLWNEPYAPPPYGFGEPAKYARFVRDVSKAVKEEDPAAQMAYPTGLSEGTFAEGILKEGIAPLFGLVNDVRGEGRKRWEAAGYTAGKYIQYEWSSLANYPVPSKDLLFTAPERAVTEIEKAKQVAHAAAEYAANEVIFSQCEWFNSWLTIYDIGMFRNTFSSDPASPQQPQPAYYVLRNMSTILSETKPAKYDVEFSNKEKPCQVYGYKKEGHPMIAVHRHGWIGPEGKRRYADIKTETGFILAIGNEIPAPIDNQPPVTNDVILKNVQAKRAVGIDSLNGLEQELIVTRDQNDTIIKGLVVRDYPLFIELLE